MNKKFFKKHLILISIFLLTFLNCCLYQQRMNCLKQNKINKSKEFLIKAPDTYFEMSIFIEELLSGKENKASLDEGLKELTSKEFIFAENSESNEALQVLIKHFFSELRFRSKSIEEPIKEFSILNTLEKREGDCLSVALIFLILSEEYNLPVYPVLVPSHIFLRFDNGHYKKNIELLDQGREKTDEIYKQKNKISEEMIQKGLLLRNLSKKEFFSYLLLNAGTFFIQNNQTDKGQRILMKTIQLNPKITGAHYNLGRSFLADDNPRCAIAFLTEELKINPYHKYSLNNRGIAYFKLGRRHKATKDFERALKIDPYNAPQKLDRAIRWMLACHNSKEEWQDGKDTEET